MLERAPALYGRRRRPLAPLGYLLALLAGLAIAVAAQCWYVRDQVLNESAFASRVTRVAREPAVRTTIVSEISDAVSGKVGLSAATVAPTVRAGVGSTSFQAVLRAGARGFNAALFHGASTGQALNVSLGGVLSSSAIPAGALDGLSVDLLNARTGSSLRYTNDAANVIRVLCVGLLVFAALALLLALLLSGRPLRVIGFTGSAVAVGGLATLPVLSHVRDRAVHGLVITEGLDPSRSETFANAIWNGFFGTMHTVAVACLVGGAIVGIAALFLSALAGGGSRRSYS